MEYKINFNNSTPIYIQIAKYFQLKVFLEELLPNDIIPSRRELSSELGVNLNTVQKSYSYMEEIGLIKTEKNKYSMITDNMDIIDTLKKEYIKEPMDQFILTMKSLKITKSQLLSLVSNYYDEVEVD